MVHRAVLLGFCAALAGGCSFGPRTVEPARLKYNTAIKASGEEQLLLNIVRLRYTDTPSNLAVTSIADQFELVNNLQITPFYVPSGSGDTSVFSTSLLPQIGLSTAIRPTISYTPTDDLEFTRKLFTPISRDSIASLGKTTWPISTVFRLWLENLNWVSNAETSSGPTPRNPPVYAEFLCGVQALQRLQDRRLAIFTFEEITEAQSDGIPAEKVTAEALVSAAKEGLEFRKDESTDEKKPATWSLVKKSSVPILRISREADGDADFALFCKTFHLDPSKRKFPLTTDQVDPFLNKAPEAGLTVLDMEPRSLLQVLFYISHGVHVPPEHACSGIAPETHGIDWHEMHDGLFTVNFAKGHKPPPCAKVAVKYQGYWFYIDERDRDTKATFALLVELARLSVSEADSKAPLLTLPIGK